MRAQIAIQAVAAVALLFGTREARAGSSTSDVFVASACVVQGSTSAEPAVTPFPAAFVFPSLFEGVVSAVASNVVVDHAAQWTPNAFGGSHFCAEFESGESIGVLTNDVNSLVLNSPPTVALHLGSRFRIRPALTLDRLFGQVLAAGGSISNADNVLLVDPASQQTRTAFISTDPTAAGWRDQNGEACATAVVPDQCAVLLQRRSAGDTLLVVHGVVKRTPAAVTIFPGLNWIAAPVLGDALTLDQLRLYTRNAATGLSPGVDATAADTLMTFDAHGQSTTYFYSSAPGLTGWRDLALANAATSRVAAAGVLLVNRKPGRENFTWRVVGGR